MASLGLNRHTGTVTTIGRYTVLGEIARGWADAPNLGNATATRKVRQNAKRDTLGLRPVHSLPK